MKAAILCPGPSIAKTWKPEMADEFDVVLGVNRAAMLGCDWWVSGDWMYLKSVIATPRVGFCTIRDVVRILIDGSLIPRLTPITAVQCIAWEDLPFQRSYSVVAALGLSCHLGATEVTVFGDDKEGAADFDGTIGENRGDSRWEEEISCMNAGIEFLNSRGIGFNVVHARG